MTGPKSTRQIILAKKPNGRPEEQDFDTVQTSVPELTNGEVLLRTQYLSVDPYMRLRMYDVEPWEQAGELVEPWADSWNVGDPLIGAAICEVIDSCADDFSSGDLVTGGVIHPLPFADYCVAHQSELTTVSREPKPLSSALGVRGMPGRTAYFGLLEIGQPKPGETVVVSAASGAVGSVVGQIAKLNGCHVVGITGSSMKVDVITDEFGFDSGLNYQSSDELSADIANAAPDGVDVYFDNVGGEISDAVRQNINVNARIPVCGQVALYNNSSPPEGPRYNYQRKRVRLEGFSHRQFIHRHDEATAQLTEWLDNGSVVHRETIVEGLENAPKAFLGIFSGEKIGKQIVKVNENRI